MLTVWLALLLSIVVVSLHFFGGTTTSLGDVKIRKIFYIKFQNKINISNVFDFLKVLNL